MIFSRVVRLGIEAHRTNVQGALHLAVGILRGKRIGRGRHLCGIGLGGSVLIGLQFILRFCLQNAIAAAGGWRCALLGAAGL